MPSKSLSSVDIAAIVEELQFIVSGKISQVYQAGDEFLLQLHVPNKGKQLLKIIPGKLLCLTQTKETQLKPSSFSMQLRKYLDNAFIISIEQPHSERIVEFALEQRENYFLIIELFSKGNLILADKDHTVIAALQKQVWKDREIAVGKKYQFPPASVDWKTLSQQEFAAILARSNKRNVVVSLATNLGVGGLYGEELCARNNIPKETAPSSLSPSQVADLYTALKKVMQLLRKPAGYEYQEGVAPFPLTGKKPLRTTVSFGELLDKINPIKKKSPYEQKMNALQRTIMEQETSLQQLQAKIDENTQKGEYIYEHYSEVQSLLQSFQELRARQGWDTALHAITKHAVVKGVDAKRKMLAVVLYTKR